MAEPVLSLHGITKRFGGVTALSAVDFELREGEVHGLVGENGAGKSTLMKVLAGIHTDYSGEMRVKGEQVRCASPLEAQRHGIGMVHQELCSFPHLSVGENLFGRALPLRYGLLDWQRLYREAQEHLNELGVDVDARASMGSLSVGRQQLVEIARVVFSGADSILLDEPTSALSAPEAERLFGFITRLKQQGKSLIFISHFLDDVIRITDRITVIKDAHRVLTTPTSESSVAELVSAMLGGTNAAQAKPAAPAAPGEAPAESDAFAEPGRTVLRCAGLAKRRAFADVSFEVKAGEILGLFAFMGAGHSELARCLFGAEKLDGGSVSLEGAPVRLRNTTHARDLGIAFVPEDRRQALAFQKEVFKNITLAHLSRLVPFWLNQDAELRVAKAQIESVALRPKLPHLLVGALSGGNQQKVVLAKWLTQTPRLLIMCEPTRGMDVGAKAEVVAIVRRLRTQGVAILLCTTEPEALVSVADRALVIRKGAITATLSHAELTKENLLKHA